MRTVHPSLLLSLAAAALLAGCATPRKPPPPATPAQIEKEMRYLQQSFPTDDCMARLRQAAPELSSKDRQNGNTLYAVEFAPNPLISDGYSYRLLVTERERLAYLHTAGGIAGWYTVHGPLPLWHCMHDRLPR